MSDAVFVYGLLTTGERLAGLLGDAERHPATVRGALFRLPVGYPALMVGGPDPVFGEVVAIDDPRKLQLLDHYFGVEQALFERARVRAVAGLRAVKAWAWVMADPRLAGGRPIPSGRWTPVRTR